MTRLLGEPQRAKREAVEVTFDEGGSRISRSRSDQEMMN